MIISRVDRKYTTDCFSKLSQSYKLLFGGFCEYSFECKLYDLAYYMYIAENT